MKSMKIVLIPIFYLVTFLTGCKKTELSPPDIRGSWVWVSTSNDGAPGPLNPLTPSNSGMIQSLSFTDSDWYFSRNSVVASSGTYTTSISANTQGETINRISFHNVNSQADSITYYSISRDTLIFSYDYSGSAGSGASVYIRTTL
jgi:hypothetical protein